MKRHINPKLWALTAVFSVLAGLAHATVTSLSLSCAPCSGAPGSTFTLTVNWCESTQWNSPLLLVAFAPQPQSAITTCPLANQYFVIYSGSAGSSSTLSPGAGYTLPNNAGTAGACHSLTFTVTVPAALTAGANYNIIAAARQDYVSCSPGAGNQDIVAAPDTFTTSPPPAAFGLTKTAEANSGIPNGLVLFSINYFFQNSHNLVITDTVPANCTLIRINNGGVAGGVTPGSTLTWTLGDTVGYQSGTLTFLCQISNAVTTGTVISNQAQGSTTEGGTQNTNTVTCTIGAGFSLAKSESIATAIVGNQVTYVLNWGISGESLINFDYYDNNTLGITNGAITGWDGSPYNVLPQGGQSGTWTIVNGGAGSDYYIHANGNGAYPTLLRSTPANYCANYTVEGDLMIDPTDAVGADAHMVIMNNGVVGAGSRGYMIGMSSDNCPADFFVQKNGATVQWGGPATCDPAQLPGTGAYDNTVGPAVQGVWYTVKALVTLSAGNVHIQARIWQRGTPEPSTWNIDWIDTASLACTGASNYYGFQADSSIDNYDNLKLFGPNVANNTRLYDTMPSGMSYVSCTNGCVAPGGAHGNMVWWDFPGATYDSTGAYTWVGQVTDCTAKPNQASIDAENGSAQTMPQFNSNVVNLTVGGGSCGSPTDTPTVTPTDTQTVTKTDTPSLTPTPTATPTYTDTVTKTNSPTLTSTPTDTPTFTDTVTKTYSPTLTATPTWSPTYSPTPTYTDTITPGPTPTFTDTYTDTPTRTSTSTWTPTRTPTPTVTITTPYSPTDTPTDTPTFTSTLTSTPTRTWTDTPTVTPTDSPTWTFTPTQTFSDTPTATPTPTPSWSFTPTKSFTATYTVSDTPTSTPTPSLTNTFSDTPTPTPSYTYTQTITDSPTFSFTPSVTWTPSVTNSYTNSPTVSPTLTWTETPIPVPYNLVIGAYNSAGELVRIIFNGSAQVLPQQLSITAQAYTTSGSPMAINLPGYLTQNGLQSSQGTSWNLENSNGQGVQSGVYYIRAIFTDPFGKVTAMVQAVEVINTDVASTLVIYNSAGEAVKHITLTGPVNDFGLGSGSAKFAPQFDSSGKNSAGALTITAKTATGGQGNYYWDGTNDQGQPVASGSYNVVLNYTGPNGQSTVVVHSVTLIKTEGGVSLADVQLGPNPVTGPSKIVVVTYPFSAGSTCVAWVYNLAGELVAQGTDPNDGGRIEITVGRLSGGLYAVVLEKRIGQVVQARKVIKLAIAK